MPCSEVFKPESHMLCTCLVVVTSFCAILNQAAAHVPGGGSGVLEILLVSRKLVQNAPGNTGVQTHVVSRLVISVDERMLGLTHVCREAQVSF